MPKKLNNKALAFLGDFKSSRDQMSGWITHAGGAYFKQIGDPSVTHCIVSPAEWKSKSEKLCDLIEDGKVKILSYEWLEDLLLSEKSVKETEYLWKNVDKREATARAKAHTAALKAAINEEDEDNEGSTDQEITEHGVHGVDTHQSQRPGNKSKRLAATADLVDGADEDTDMNEQTATSKGKGKAAASKPTKPAKATKPKAQKTQGVIKGKVTKEKGPKKQKMAKKEFVRPDATAHFAKRLEARKAANAQGQSVDTTDSNRLPNTTDHTTEQAAPTKVVQGPIGIPEGYRIFEEGQNKWDALLLRIHNSSRNDRFFLRIFQSEANTEQYQVGLRYSGEGYKHTQTLGEHEVDITTAKISFKRAYKELTGQDFEKVEDEEGLFVGQQTTAEAIVVDHEASEIIPLEGMPTWDNIRETPFVHQVVGGPKKRSRVEKGKARAG